MMRRGLFSTLSALRVIPSLAVLVVAASIASSAQDRTADVAPEIDYTVSMSKPHTHLLEVEIRIWRPKELANTVDLVMPVWTPGSYMVREFARHVQDFKATDAAGKELSWTKIDKNTWRVTTVGLARLARFVSSLRKRTLCQN